MMMGSPSMDSIFDSQGDSKNGRQTSIRNFFACKTIKQKASLLRGSSSTIVAQAPNPNARTRATDSLENKCDVEYRVGVSKSSDPNDFLYGNFEKTLYRRSIAPRTFGSSKQTLLVKRKRAPQQQLYLDFGQRNFGATVICDTCGMLCVHGVDADVQRHSSVCQNYMEGVRWNVSALKPCFEWNLPLAKTGARNIENDANQRRILVSKRSRTILDRNATSPGLTDCACIIEIRPSEQSRYSKTLELLHNIVDQELGFVSDSATKKHDLTTYLCIVNKRVVGMVLVEEISAAYRLLASPQDESTAPSASTLLPFGLTRSTKPTKAVLGIYQLWVHGKHRSRGIASILVDIARKQMIFGYASIPVEQLAFSSPTESGLAFAQSYCAANSRDPPNVHRVLVYDCG